MQPVYNDDGTIYGYVDDPIDDDMEFPEDEYGNQIRGNGVKVSIWDDGVKAPGGSYQYRPPPRVPTNQFRPWAQDGNPWWGQPSVENNARLSRMRKSDGMPYAPQGKVERHNMVAGWFKSKFGTETKQVRKKGRWL